MFVYGTLLRGEPSHHLLAATPLVGAATTGPHFDLFDLGDYPAMVPGGETAVAGELYTVGSDVIRALDRFEGHPRFYRRRIILLQGGDEAEAYLLRPDQVTGRRRIPSGDWRRDPGRGR